MTTTGTTSGETTSGEPVSGPATDLQDERLRTQSGWRGTTSVAVRRVRDGDLGVLPVVAGLVVIWTILQILNPVFLSSANLVNLTLESASVGVIALGIVCVLLVGQIDLSVGSVSGLSSAVLATLFVDRGLPVWLAVAAAVLAGAAIGLVYAVLHNRFGVPSFVITLAGLLGFMGLQLYILGAKGSINLPFDSGLVTFAQLAFLPPWLSYVLVAVAGAGLFASGHLHARARAAAGLSARSTGPLLARSIALVAVLGVAVWYLNRTRGVGWMFVFFLALV
ncbi:MAG: ABC transporter permease subunit, partial [Nocardioidaceae bacterium]